MAQGIRRPHEAVDFAAIERMYPPPPEYFETAYYEDRDRRIGPIFQLTLAGKF